MPPGHEIKPPDYRCAQSPCNVNPTGKIGSSPTYTVTIPPYYEAPSFPPPNMLSVASNPQQPAPYRPVPLKSHHLAAQPGRHQDFSLPFIYGMSGPPNPAPSRERASASASATPNTTVSTPSSVTSSSAPPPLAKPSVDPVVCQALEIARESPDGAADPTISNILETALSHLWAKVQAAPEAYVMTRDEFSLFNFYQHRFVGDRVAVLARRRYWDNACA